MRQSHCERENSICHEHAEELVAPVSIATSRLEDPRRRLVIRLGIVELFGLVSALSLCAAAASATSSIGYRLYSTCVCIARHLVVSSTLPSKPVAFPRAAFYRSTNYTRNRPQCFACHNTIPPALWLLFHLYSNRNITVEKEKRRNKNPQDIVSLLLLMKIFLAAGQGL